MEEKRLEISSTKKALGAMCHYCPICRYGRRNPGSLVGRALHHRFHADHCPFWKAEKELYVKPEGGAGGESAD